MVQQSIWIGITIAVFFVGIGVSYAIFSSTNPNTIKFQNQQLFDQMMSQNPKMTAQWMETMMQDAQFRDQLMDYMAKNPEQMNQWMMQDPKHIEEMSTAMKENHDFMMGMLSIMIEDPSLRLQMIGHLTENPEALNQMKQMMGENAIESKEDPKMETMTEMLDDAKSVTVPDSPFRIYDISEVAYFAMGPGNLIKIVDTTTHEIVDILPANNNPHGIAITSDGRYIFTTSTKMGPNEMLMEPAHDDPGDAEMDMKMMMSLGSNEIAVTDRMERNIINFVQHVS